MTSSRDITCYDDDCTRVEAFSEIDGAEVFISGRSTID
jgi:hypothetical protein